MTLTYTQLKADLRVLAASALLFAVGCGGAPASEAGSTTSSVIPAHTGPTTTVRVFCDGEGAGVFASYTSRLPFGGPTATNVPLRVEVPAVTHATRARVAFDTVAGEVRGYVNTSALGLVVQETTMMIGAPVHLGVGGEVCVPLHGETPSSFPAEATVYLPAGWTFELTPPVRVQGTRYTWRGRVPRSAVALTSARSDRSYSGQFDGATLELLTGDGRVLARGPAPRTGTMIRGRNGDLLEVALTQIFGVHGLHGFIRSPPEPEPAPRSGPLGSQSGSFAMGGVGVLESAASLPREARVLSEVATERPLHALIPGAIFTLPTGQQLSLPDPSYARVTVGTRWVLVVFADKTVLAGTVDPTAIGEMLVEAVAP